MCGVSISTANAVWAGLIREYPVMLCSGYEQKLVDKIKFPAYAQMKMDGMRFNAIVKDGAVEYRSRNGKEINLLGNLDEQFLAMADGGDYVFDGELMVMDEDSCQFVDRQTGNGILNKANKGTISDKEAAKVHASVWDMIPYVLFCDSYSDTVYATRFSKLEGMVAKQNPKDKRVWLVTSTIVQTIEEATAIFEDYLSSGYEGIILKDGNGVWEDKRAKHQIKFKGELECDLKIVGTEPHKKKPEWLGAIICESADGIIKVNVGSGFNDTHRKSYKEKDILGKIVAIKYNARIKNKSGEESLFLPVFVEIREDKDSADSSKEVK
jgi:ATP-dependent DNA ligase